VFFKLSEKQPVVLSKQPIVLHLDVFERLKTVLGGWLAVKPKQPIDSHFQSIVCLKILTETILLVKWALNVFITEYAPALNALTILWML